MQRNANTVIRLNQEPLIWTRANYALIEAAVKPADLARDWSEGNGPFFFCGKAPGIVVRKGDDRWLDPRRCRIGTGAISLAAHVLGVTTCVAASLLARFAAIRDGVSANDFYSPMTSAQDAEQEKAALIFPVQ
jgi:hypothetical protein